MGDTNRKRIARQQARLNQDICAVASTAAGLRFMRALLAAHGIYRSSFDVTSERMTAFNEGDRNAGLRLLAWLDEADPTIYERIIKIEQEQKQNERRERERAADQRRNDGDDGGDDAAGD